MTLHVDSLIGQLLNLHLQTWGRFLDIGNLRNYCGVGSWHRVYLERSRCNITKSEDVSQKLNLNLISIDLRNIQVSQGALE